jgi:hypothetical protein
MTSTRVVIGFLSMLWIGCSGEPTPPAERLLETWRPDIEASLDVNPQTKPLSSQNRIGFRKIAGRFLDGIRYRFTPEGLLHRIINGNKETHAYRITGKGAHGLELEVDDGLEPRHVQVVFHDDLLFWKRGNHTLVFEED